MQLRKWLVPTVCLGAAAGAYIAFGRGASDPALELSWYVVADLPGAGNLEELRAYLEAEAGLRDMTLHRLLWRGSHLVRVAVSGLSWPEVRRSLEAQGMRVRDPSPEVTWGPQLQFARYVFTVVAGGVTSGRVEHDLEVVLDVSSEGNGAMVRTGCVQAKLGRGGICGELLGEYPEGSVGRAFFESPQAMTHGKTWTLVKELEFRWIFTCPSSGWYGGDMEFKSGVEVEGTFECAECGSQMLFRVEACSDLDPGGIRGELRLANHVPKEALSGFESGRFAQTELPGGMCSIHREE